MKEYPAVVKQNIEIAKGIFAMTLTLPEDVEIKGGQFANISTGSDRLLLKRPLGIVKHDGADVTLCYRVVGAGTKLLSEKVSGDALAVLLPLGNGFRIRPEEKDVVVIGGGVGIFPLVPVMAQNPDKRFHSFVGFRDRESLCLLDEFEKGTDLTVVTDDGSYGEKGNAVDAYFKKAADVKADLIIACGPQVMFRALKKKLDESGRGVRCLVSLEERMGCGIGACLVCACDMADGSVARVCRDGPVFDINDVVL
ncbi:MAG: dihydroorotate dehydrogenase electron transfer subunit [Clostridia bacterium]|nr:dihydroorotate dehydrogenase electron transfer subunit [Clostridia bacterium]